jgi:hypothetical protein
MSLVIVPVPDEPRHHARVPVHHLEQCWTEVAVGVVAARVHQRVDAVVAGQYSQTIGVVEQRDLDTLHRQVGGSAGLEAGQACERGVARPGLAQLLRAGFVGEVVRVGHGRAR